MDFALKGGTSFGMKKVITDVARDQIQQIKKETEAQKSINNKQKNNTFAQDKQNNTQENKKTIQQKNNDTIRNAYPTQKTTHNNTAKDFVVRPSTLKQYPSGSVSIRLANGSYLLEYRGVTVTTKQDADLKYEITHSDTLYGLVVNNKNCSQSLLEDLQTTKSKIDKDAMGKGILGLIGGTVLVVMGSGIGIAAAVANPATIAAVTILVMRTLLEGTKYVGEKALQVGKTVVKNAPKVLNPTVGTAVVGTRVGVDVVFQKLITNRIDLLDALLTGVGGVPLRIIGSGVADIGWDFNKNEVLNKNVFAKSGSKYNKPFDNAVKEMLISSVFAGLPLPKHLHKRLLDTTSAVEFKTKAYEILKDMAEKGTTELIVPQK